MIAHSYPKRSTRALPQVESTIYLDVAAPALRFTARAGFTVGHAHVNEGDTCIAVKSLRRQNRYYIVKFNATRQCLQCSCGLNFSDHDHLRTAQQYAESHSIDMEAKAEPLMPRKRTESRENALTVDVTAQSKPIDWKAVQKRDRARQKALNAEYWQKVEEARAQDARAVAK
jgi:hypothetical protein